MDYKILIKLFLPELEQSFEMYIPVNRTIGQVIELMNKVVNDITLNVYPIKEGLQLMNRRNNTFYEYNDLIRNTNIRNGTELVMF
ncbi:MAG: hypothetical protein ACI4U0_06660 [Candidatus Aphodocola sp.]